jgi:hypothetical protein
MTKEELKTHVELELQWLRYYANEPSRLAFDPSKSPYDQLISIGYAKRYTVLAYRCVFVRITSVEPVKTAKIEDLIETGEPRSVEGNIYSALETYMLRYPEEHSWIVEYMTT